MAKDKLADRFKIQLKRSSSSNSSSNKEITRI